MVVISRVERLSIIIAKARLRREDTMTAVRAKKSVQYHYPIMSTGLKHTDTHHVK
jgi:hypothetical protein